MQRRRCGAGKKLTARMRLHESRPALDALGCSCVAAAQLTDDLVLIDVSVAPRCCLAW